MNVGDASVLVSGSEITTPGHPEHEELIATGESTIATMKYGQPQITLAPAGDNTMATGNMTIGRQCYEWQRDSCRHGGAPHASATAGASTGADATSTTSANNTMATDTAAAGGSKRGWCDSTTAGASTMAAGPCAYDENNRGDLPVLRAETITSIPAFSSLSGTGSKGSRQDAGGLAALPRLRRRDRNVLALCPGMERREPLLRDAHTKLRAARLRVVAPLQNFGVFVEPGH